MDEEEIMSEVRRLSLPAVLDDFGIIHIGMALGMGLAICGEMGEPSYYFRLYDLGAPDFCSYCATMKSSLN